MKQTMLRSTIMLCLLLLALTGCSQNSEKHPNQSRIWKTMPPITYGVMEYEKLEAQSWYSGRCEATSLNRMAETENGFYQTYQTTLYYADKTDISNWVPVCSKPDCNHINNCNATVPMARFLVRDGRIIYEVQCQDCPQFYSGNGYGYILVSSASNGMDKKLEYLSEDSMIFTAGHYGSVLTDDQLILATKELQTDGTITARAYRITANGKQELYCIDGLENSNVVGGISTAYNYFNMRGDTYIYNNHIEVPAKTVFRFDGEEMVELNAANLPVNGSYISGNTLRYFIPNDGYYDRNTETGEEIRIADAMLENSTSDIVLPNCIIESNFLYKSSTQNRAGDVTPALEIFDGETWHSVNFPSELEKVTQSTYLAVLGVTSDSILLGIQDHSSRDTTGLRVYKIDITSSDWNLEYQCEILSPHVIAHLEQMRALNKLK